MGFRHHCAGIYFADPTAAGQSCAASHVLESLLLGACALDPAIAGTPEGQFGDTFVTPCTLAAALGALVNAGLDLALPVPLSMDPSANLNILDARITALLGSVLAPDATVIGDRQLIMCHTGDHEVPQLPGPGLDVGWPGYLRFSELTGHDGRLGPRGTSAPWRVTSCCAHGGTTQTGSSKSPCKPSLRTSGATPPT